MALINCPECDHDVSEFAISCPNCGYQISTMNKTYDNIKSNNNMGNIHHRLLINPMRFLYFYLLCLLLQFLYPHLIY